MEVILHDELSLTRIVNSVYASNSYLIRALGERDAWMVDCGDSGPVLRLLLKERLVLRGVFLTHVHYDHIYGLNEIKCRYPQLRVYTSEPGRQNLYSPKYNFSKYHRADFWYGSDDVTLLRNEDRVELFPGREMLCFETPGHDWSCLTYRLDEWVFTGDAYIPGLKTVTTFPKSDRRQADMSLKIMQTLITSRTLVCPGHGPVSINPMF